MKYLISIFVLVTWLYSRTKDQPRKQRNEQTVEEETRLDTLTLKSKSSFNFEYSSDDPGKFGFRNFEHDLPVGPQDILLTDNSIYVLDRYHNNIKKVDFNGNIILSSEPLSNQNIWLKQFTVLNNKILIISELDSLDIYSESLELIERKYLQKGNPRIIQSTSDKIVLYYPMNAHEFVELNELGNITNRVAGIEHKSHYKSELSYTNSSIISQGEIFVTDPVDMRELIHSVNDRTIVTLFVADNQLTIEIFNF